MASRGGPVQQCAVPQMKVLHPDQAIFYLCSHRDNICNVFVCLEQGLPHGFIGGVSFLHMHGSVINLANGAAFKPAPMPCIMCMPRGGVVANYK